jgi:pyruvate/2-oxoglutarate dehydrogenase complex dihydrolipoamide dehydrogenase (E3) component
MVDDVLKSDLCIIGAGSGGLSVAAAAAALGVSAVLVEKGPMGGDCLNFGCVPSKALLAAAAAAAAQRGSAVFGVRPHEPRIDFAAVHQHIRSVIDAITPNDSEARFSAMGVRVIRAPARFIGPDSVEAGGLVIKARRFVVATGSQPLIPAIPGLDLVHYLTNETVFDLRELPTRLVILGAGPTGVELAQAFRRLGSDVVVLETDRALAGEDEELARPLLDRLAREGIDLREGARVLRIEPRHGAGVRIVLEGEVEAAGETIDGTHLIVATGRRPNVEGMGLDLGNIAFDQAGIAVSGSLRSLTNRKVYAIGDVAAVDGKVGANATHVANYHAGLVVRATLFRLRVHVDQNLLPRVIFTDPELASVGATSEEARQRHRTIRVWRWPFSQNDRALSQHRDDGHIRVITTRDGEILGASILGPHAGELITPWTLAIKKRLNITDMADLVIPYPTLSEVSKRAALLSQVQRAASPWLSPVLRLISRFG